MKYTNLTSHFLIAIPQPADFSFASTLTLVCRHTSDGAQGIIINRPTSLRVSKMFKQIGIESPDTRHHSDDRIYAGGPVSVDRGFVLDSGEIRWESSVDVCHGIQLSTSRDVLLAMANHRGPTHCLVALGYAGWDAGQLERELANNIWLTCKADSDIIFCLPPSLRLQAAASILGVDLNLIPCKAGHA
ncbi:hypothetical protein CI610_01888 [invertebrate metagenome]|uniref:Uncharacterized protein n=1 Tax=invertebrate metagenome TaxID=1711999 RepID=A0A2H9T7H1_9ZZZZ